MLGTPAIQTDEEGAVYNRQASTPYGIRTAHEGGSADEFKFTDKAWDDDLGLIYFGARYYDPELGTWISVDPKVLWGDDGSLSPFDANPMAYVGGRVTIAIDVFGFEGDEEGTPKVAAGRGQEHMNQLYEENPDGMVGIIEGTGSATKAMQEALNAGFQKDQIHLYNPETGESTPAFSEKRGGEAEEGGSLLGLLGDDLAEQVFSVAGLLPVVGEIADVATALKDLFEGEFLNAGLASAGVLIPFVSGGSAKTAVQGAGFVVTEGGTAVHKSQKVMVESLEEAGIGGRKLPNGKGAKFELPNGVDARAMEPNQYAPRRTSFTNRNGGPVNPEGTTPQPPRGLNGPQRKSYVRERTHVKQTK